MKMKLANHSDLTLAAHGHLPASRVCRYECEGAVDSGAMQMVLPQAAMDALGLPV